jgi:hypothetical protein
LPLGIPTMVKQALFLADWDHQDPEDNNKLKVGNGTEIPGKNKKSFALVKGKILRFNNI